MSEKHKPNPKKHKRQPFQKCECDRIKPTFGLLADGILRWCYICKIEGAVNLRNKKRCECGRSSPTFGLQEDGIAKWCSLCRKKDAINVVTKRCLCGKHIPTFGLKDGIAKWCSLCREDNAIDVKSKRCVCGRSTGPTFGLKEDGIAKWCLLCKEKDAIDVKNKRCQCGRSAGPIFGLKEDGIPHWCSLCRILGAIDVVHRRCICGLNVNPLFNFAGEKQGIYCSQCKVEGCVNVVHAMCKCGEAVPHFIAPGDDKPLYCSKCAGSDTIDNRVQKSCKLCPNKGPRYNLPGEKIGIYCIQCKNDECIDVTRKRCECGKAIASMAIQGGKKKYCKNCPSRPAEAVFFPDAKSCVCKKGKALYRKPGEKSRSFCVLCRPDDFEDPRALCVCKSTQPSFKMPNDEFFTYCSKCRPYKSVGKYIQCVCGKNAYYGNPGERETCCFQCKSVHMIRKPRKRCLVGKCKDFAVFGQTKRMRCEEHKHEGDVNLVEERCTSCGLLGLLNGDNQCITCKPSVFNEFIKKHELRIKSLLDANGFKYASHDKIANGVDCGKERPDFVFDCGTHIVILEVDEDQHSGYQCLCEQTRMINITQGFGGMRIFWIRFNPDSFKLPDGTNSNITNNAREKHLLEWVKYAQERVPKNLGEVVYLFYNKCENKTGPDQIQVLPSI